MSELFDKQLIVRKAFAHQYAFHIQEANKVILPEINCPYKYVDLQGESRLCVDKVVTITVNACKMSWFIIIPQKRSDE